LNKQKRTKQSPITTIIIMSISPRRRQTSELSSMLPPTTTTTQSTPNFGSTTPVVVAAASSTSTSTTSTPAWWNVMSFIPTVGSALAIGFGVWHYSDKLNRMYSYVNWVTSVWPFWFAFGHMISPNRVATSIGWPQDSPFQWEVAMANLSIGLTNLFVSVSSFDYEAYRAMLILWGAWTLGTLCIHILDALKNKNYALNNLVVPLLFSLINLAYTVYLLV
jgi:hypothetical protein